MTDSSSAAARIAERLKAAERVHLEPLHDALAGLYDMAINWRNTEWRMVSVTNPPGRGVTLDTPIVFHVHVPPGSRHGPQIHRPTLRKL